MGGCPGILKDFYSWKVGTGGVSRHVSYYRGALPRASRYIFATIYGAIGEIRRLICVSADTQPAFSRTQTAEFTDFADSIVANFSAIDKKGRYIPDTPLLAVGAVIFVRAGPTYLKVRRGKTGGLGWCGGPTYTTGSVDPGDLSFVSSVSRIFGRSYRNRALA